MAVAVVGGAHKSYRAVSKLVGLPSAIPSLKGGNARLESKPIGRNDDKPRRRPPCLWRGPSNGTIRPPVGASGLPAVAARSSSQCLAPRSRSKSGPSGSAAGSDRSGSHGKTVSSSSHASPELTLGEEVQRVGHGRDHGHEATDYVRQDEHGGAAAEHPSSAGSSPRHTRSRNSGEPGRQTNSDVLRGCSEQPPRLITARSLTLTARPPRPGLRPNLTSPLGVGDARAD